MNIANVTTKAEVGNTGLTVHRELSFQEWRGLAPRFGQAAASFAFAIGDWLLYGEQNFLQPNLPGFNDPNPSRRVPLAIYEMAIAETRMDRGTLQQYAYVARNVPNAVRSHLLSWEHHKAVAKLESDEQTHWLKLALSESKGDSKNIISTRRLRKSIAAGRLLTVDETTTPTDRGITNHIPFVNRLSAWWKGMVADGWLDRATDEQKAALKRDLQPVLDIIDDL